MDTTLGASLIAFLLLMLRLEVDGRRADSRAMDEEASDRFVVVDK